MDQHRWIVSIGLVALLSLGWLSFSPGFSGPFFFDDYVHLQKLEGVDGHTDTLVEVTRLVFPQHQGTGRSLAYLSLLIDDNAWPTDPQLFKRTNTLLHLLNGVLIFWLTRVLGSILRQQENDSPDPDLLALSVAALWLLHPMHLSPTMMIIQRMTIIAGTFSILALLAYLHGRTLAVYRPYAGYIWMTIVFGSMVALGLLGKDTAIMTLCFVVALEATLLSRAGVARPPLWRAWAWLALVLPLAIVALYLVLNLNILVESYRNRSFDLPERLMTQARVLIEYLSLVIAPHLSGVGPFRDDYVVSRSLVAPISTAFSLIVIALLITTALAKRRTWAIFAFAVLWFFLGHTLEGTVIPLELYFEHRNYLPMYGVFFAMSYLVMRAKTKSRIGLSPILWVYASFFATLTYFSAQVWGSSAEIANVWATEHPRSPRAQILAVRYWAKQGNGVKLAEQLDAAEAAAPGHVGPPLYRLLIDRCRDLRLPPIGGSLKLVEKLASTSRYDPLALESLSWLTSHDDAPPCRFTAEEISHIFTLLLANRNFTQSASVRYQLYMLKAAFHQRLGNVDSLIESLDGAFEALPFFELALDQAYFLAINGDISQAENYIEKAATAPPTSLYDRLWRDQRVSSARTALAGMKSSAEAPPSSIRGDSQE